MSIYNDDSIKDISGSEKEKIRHEINTYYAKYEGLKIIAHPSVGMDNRFYIYFIENYGFDDYVIFGRVDNLY